jgi:Icc protein
MAVPFKMDSILWLSDCHIDHLSHEDRTRLTRELRNSAGDVVVVTGDTSTGKTLIADLEFVADAAARPVYFVLGNHDHFNSTIANVRDAAIALAARRPALQWLPPAGVVQLAAHTVLVGVDGWADGRLGNPLNTPLVLNDDRLIGEIAALSTRVGKLAVKRALADADAARLAVLLDRAVPDAHTIIVATHVPPFAEALPRTGRLSNPHWLPLMVCGAVGAVLKRFAAEYRDRRFVVLCGHTHVATDVMIAENLRCIVAGARYGEPRFDSLVLSSLK